MVILTRKLALEDTAASRRWQLYGHLLANRVQEAEQLADQLPIEDGFVLATRIYLAHRRGDDRAMQQAYAQIDRATNPPMSAEYRAVLISEFESGGNEIWPIRFDGPDGTIFPRGGSVNRQRAVRILPLRFLVVSSVLVVPNAMKDGSASRVLFLGIRFVASPGRLICVS